MFDVIGRINVLFVVCFFGCFFFLLNLDCFFEEIIFCVKVLIFFKVFIFILMFLCDYCSLFIG